MNAIPVIAIFDVGKTNKKLLLFDEEYKLVFENSRQIPETEDEDGFPCEDVSALTAWVKESFNQIIHHPAYEIKGVNFSGYGASFVYLDESKQLIPPLYNYLKPFPEPLSKKFYNDYGGMDHFSKQTASPVLGHLNSGMQLYRLKYVQPEKFSIIAHALHLPQYVSYILSGAIHSDITSIGCHTNLWDFPSQSYHSWVEQEGLLPKLAPLRSGDAIVGQINERIPVGIGLHDSSAALIPYLFSFKEPFVLLSTGTWAISLNAFNNEPLTTEELAQDCLCYLSFMGKSVKASRLFAGHDHEKESKRIAAHFHLPDDYYKQVAWDTQFAPPEPLRSDRDQSSMKELQFRSRELSEFGSFEHAYHQLMIDIMHQQVWSTSLVMSDDSITRIFVDGGFSNNAVYMNLLSIAFPRIEVYAASVPQASALGAALAIHPHWNSKPVSRDLIQLRLF